MVLATRAAARAGPRARGNAPAARQPAGSRLSCSAVLPKAHGGNAEPHPGAQHPLAHPSRALLLTAGVVGLGLSLGASEVSCHH